MYVLRIHNYVFLFPYTAGDFQVGLTLESMPDYAEENGGVMVYVTLNRTDSQRIDLERSIIVNLDLINRDAGGYCFVYIIVL